MKVTLPLFLKEDNKVFTGVCIFILMMIAYLLSNHFHYYQPQQLPLTWVDRTIPFLPNSFWLYNSEYFYFVAVYMSASNLQNLNKFIYSTVTMVFFGCVIFSIWPTTYPRELFPLPNDLNYITYHLFSLFRETDTPANCCPSLHVSAVILLSFIFLSDKRNLFPYYFAWAVAITISTLTTKQHYFIDVVGGLTTAILFYWLFHHKLQFRKIDHD